MKTVEVSKRAGAVNALLEQARDEDVIVRAADGTEYLLGVLEDFDYEIARTRRNARLMAFLEERARQTKTIPLEEAKRVLGLDKREARGTIKRTKK